LNADIVCEFRRSQQSAKWPTVPRAHLIRPEPIGNSEVSPVSFTTRNFGRIERMQESREVADFISNAAMRFA